MIKKSTPETPGADAVSPETIMAFEADLRTWFVHDDLNCLACDYNMRGLVGPVVICPECGQHNDLTDPSPWRKIALPLGVQNPEHWPSTAVGLSTLIPAGIWISMMLFLGGAGARLMFVGFVATTLLMIGMWGILCRNWIRSCASKRWAWLVLANLHLSTYLMLPIPVTLYVTIRRMPLILLAVLPLLGVIGFFWGKFLIDRGDRQSAFRVDWRRWQLPLGVIDPESE